MKYISRAKTFLPVYVQNRKCYSKNVCRKTCVRKNHYYGKIHL